MRICIAVHSKTGVTLALAEAVAGRLREKGHEAAVLPLDPEGDVQPHQKGVRLKNSPGCGGYDALLVGGPVWAFGVSPVALAFASGLGDMKGAKALPFVTMGFRLKLMGGYQGISALSRGLSKTGATVLPGVIASAWAARSDAEKRAVVERIVTILEG